MGEGFDPAVKCLSLPMHKVPIIGFWVPELEDQVAVSLELQWGMCGRCRVLALISGQFVGARQHSASTNGVAVPSKHRSLWYLFVCGCDIRRYLGL